MSLTMKRYRYLILIAILFLWVLVYYWTYRVISINIWNKWEVTTDYFDIDNTIDLFDTTQVHEIKILMTEEEYKDMIDTYVNTSEKDWFKTDVIIDGVLIADVWIRLKWNSSLRWMWDWKWWWASLDGMDRWKWKNRTWSWNNMMWWFHGNMRRWWGWWFPWMWSGWNFQDMPFPWAFEWWSFGPGMMSWDSVSYDSQLPLFIKFNKYVDQTYQWHEMVSLRVWWMWSDETLLAEPYSYELYQAVWQPAPDTSYWSVQIDWKDIKLFIISELPEDKYYIQRRFWDDNWILYKAWNFIDFSYLWEDPTLYSDYFTQKTMVNDYDFSPLIRMLKFITESDDEEFEEEINNYIDVESVLTVLAIDDFVWNNDSFGWMWSNYYLYYNLWEKRFYLLTWDQNLAFGSVWWGNWWVWSVDVNFKGNMAVFWWNSWENIDTPNFNFEWFGWFGTWEERPAPLDFNWWLDNPWFSRNMWNFSWWFQWWGDWVRKWWSRRNGDNLLKTRLLTNEQFKAMYDEIYTEVENVALDSDFSDSFFNERSSAFYGYGRNNELVSRSTYSQWLQKLKSYLESKKITRFMNKKRWK